MQAINPGAGRSRPPDCGKRGGQGRRQQQERVRCPTPSPPGGSGEVLFSCSAGLRNAAPHRLPGCKSDHDFRSTRAGTRVKASHGGRGGPSPGARAQPPQPPGPARAPRRPRMCACALRRPRASAASGGPRRRPRRHLPARPWLRLGFLPGWRGPPSSASPASPGGPRLR